MSKATKIILAVVVLIFAWLMCSLSFSGSGGALESLAPFIGMLVGVMLAVGTYFGLDWVGRWTSARQEKQAHSILFPHVPSGETLQAFTYGYVGPGRTGMVIMLGALGDALVNAPRRKWYYVGVTERRFILVQVKDNKPTGVQQMLARHEVQRLEFVSGAFKEPHLAIGLPAETMTLKVEGYTWMERAKALSRVWRGEPA